MFICVGIANLLVAALILLTLPGELAISVGLGLGSMLTPNRKCVSRQIS